MSKQDDYRKNAAETLDLAQRAASSADKGRLLALAEAWLDLADRAEGFGQSSYPWRAASARESKRGETKPAPDETGATE